MVVTQRVAVLASVVALRLKRREERKVEELEDVAEAVLWSPSVAKQYCPAQLRQSERGLQTPPCSRRALPCRHLLPPASYSRTRSPSSVRGSWWANDPSTPP